MWQLALSLLETVTRARVCADVYSTAMAACTKAGAWQQALALFQAMQGATIRQDAFSYSAAISAAITQKGQRSRAGGVRAKELTEARANINDNHLFLQCACNLRAVLISTFMYV